MSLISYRDTANNSLLLPLWTFDVTDAQVQNITVLLYSSTNMNMQYAFMHEKKQMHRPIFFFFLIITYMHTKTPHTCKHTKDIIIQTSSQWCYKQMKGQRRIMRVGKQSCTDSGVHLGGNTAFYSITHYFMKNLMRIGWSEGRREMPGWKRQQGKGWGDRESMRTEVSSFLCGWLCLTVFVHACVHFLTCIAGCLSALACKQKAWLIWTSYERYVLVCALLFVWA